jgi:glycosyltransferase involved in cell wall biosynthesis
MTKQLIEQPPPPPSLVSVAMVTYKHRPYIAQALDSVLAQRRDFPIEIVISDDCSPDGTAAVIDDYEKAHPGLFRRLDPPQNVGMNANFSRVWQACTGKFIAFLDGDDWWHSPDKLATQVAFMERHPECTISGHLCESQNLVGENSARQGLTEQPELFDAEDLIAGVSSLMTPSVMCRGGVVPRVPDWAMSMGFLDLPMFLLHATRGRIGFINQPLSTYRVHSGGVWSSKSTMAGLDCLVRGFTVMRSNFAPKFRSCFDARLAEVTQFLFHAYRREGRHWQARWQAGKAVWLSYRSGKLTTGLAVRSARWILYPGALGFRSMFLKRA